MFRRIQKLAPILGLLLLWPSVCLGHGMNLFCWTKQDTVQCKSRFSGGRPVHNATWRVLDASSGDRLLSGATGSEGGFSFSPPPKAGDKRLDLKVVCEADTGHRDSWTVRAADYLSGVSGHEEDQKSGVEREEATEGSESVEGIGEERLRRIVNQELAPVRKELARLREPGVTLRDALGGLGYILGLVGIWAFAASRRESRQ
jgi:nickel transport protein